MKKTYLLVSFLFALTTCLNGQTAKERVKNFDFGHPDLKSNWLELDYATVHYKDDPGALNGKAMRVMRAKKYSGKNYGNRHGGMAQSIIPCPQPGAKYQIKARAYAEILSGETPGEVVLEFFNENKKRKWVGRLAFTSKTYSVKTNTITVPDDAKLCRVWFRKTGEGDFSVDYISLKAINNDTPNVPTGLTSSFQGTSQIVLNWDEVPGAIGYEINRKYSGDPDRKFRTVNKTVEGGSSTTFLDTSDAPYTSNISPGSSYSYQVRAIGDFKDSPWSTAITVSTKTPTPSPNNTSYFIDATLGDDANDGKSEITPWKSFKNLDLIKLSEGCKVLLKSGERWFEPLYVHGEGSSANPIVIKAYGGGDLPFINPKGKALECIGLEDVQYVEVSGLELSNVHRYWREFDRSGVRIRMANSSEMNSITIKDLYVHDIECVDSRGNQGSGGTGIRTERTDGLKTGVFKNITIENCILKDVQHFPLFIEFTNNIQLIGNTIRRGGFVGLNFKDVVGGMVENNIISQSGRYMTSRDNAAMDIYSSDGITFQHNIVSDTYNHSGQSHNLDASNNMLIQYNYFKNSAAGAFIMTRGCDNNTYRYNIIEKFNGELLRDFGSNRTKFLNNVAYLAPNQEAALIQSMHNGTLDYPDRMQILNNIFYIDGKSSGIDLEKGALPRISSNVFYGRIDDNSTFGSRAYKTNPRFVNPGGGSANSYKLQGSSPCILKAERNVKTVNADYWGNYISDKPRDIGAHEYSSTTSARRSNKINELDNLKEQGFIAYPTLIKKGNFITIEQSFPENYTLIMNDVNGNVIYKSFIQKSNNTLIPTEGISSGVYFLRLSTHEETKVIKVIIY